MIMKMIFMFDDLKICVLRTLKSVACYRLFRMLCRG